MKRSYFLIIVMCLVCLATISAASAADLMFSGKVMEFTSDGSSKPVEGMRVYLDVDFDGVRQILGSTFTDKDGTYVLQYPSSIPANPSAVIIRIELIKTGYIITEIKTNGGSYTSDIGTVNFAYIAYKSPLFGKDLGNNVFVIENTDQSLPLGTVLISSGSIQGSSGTAQVPITVKGADTIGNMDIVIDHSACTGLEYTDATAGSLTQNSLTSAKDTGTAVNIGIVDSKGISGEGSLMYLKYVINSADAPPCTLKVTSVAGNKLDGTEIKFATGDGKFSSGALEGDCNKDGSLTSVDALMAVQMSTGEITTDLVADMNGDGKVTSFDAIRILQSADKSRITGLPGNEPESDVTDNSRITGRSVKESEPDVADRKGRRE